jgi:hypothetical protein
LLTYSITEEEYVGAITNAATEKPIIPTRIIAIAITQAFFHRDFMICNRSTDA